jgi:hypothetical protein
VSKETGRLLVESKGYVKLLIFSSYSDGEVGAFCFNTFPSGGAHPLYKVAEML